MTTHLTSLQLGKAKPLAALLLAGPLLLASCSQVTKDDVAPTPGTGVADAVMPPGISKIDERNYQNLVDSWMPVLIGGQAGGSLTTTDFSADAFHQPAPGLPAAMLAAHQSGRAGFDKIFSLRALAPLWVNQSCVACHVGGGRAGIAKDGNPQLLFRVSQPGMAMDGGPVALPGFGLQIQPVAVGPDSTRVVSAEGKVTTSYVEQLRTLADGSSVSLRQPSYSFSVPLPAGALYSPRTGSQVAGLGLLEAVPEATILAIATNQASAPSFGITGHPNYVWDANTKSTKMGRFGWKANQATLPDQNAGAYNGDLGVTTGLFPLEPDGTVTVGGGVDLSDQEGADVDTYTRTLGVPALRTPTDGQVAAGRALFMSAKCAVCHVPVLKTGSLPGFPMLSNQTITPFTDLLLHDMGPGLADNRPDFRASGSEWRTAPLWGMGLSQTTSKHTNLLHDGRARNALEAIMWHDGEAASSRRSVEQMSAAQRTQLLAFLGSL